MVDLGKNLIILGLILAGAGCLIFILAKFTNISRLPGDIFIKKENFSFYFPITTCILASVVLSLIMFFISKK